MLTCVLLPAVTPLLCVRVGGHMHACEYECLRARAFVSKSMWACVRPYVGFCTHARYKGKYSGGKC